MLNEEQNVVCKKALEGKSLFITGAAGTGKSYLLREIIGKLRNAGKNVVVTAITGTAAVRIGGTTVHRAFGFNAQICCDQDGNPIINTPKLIKNADTVVIDEISMARIDLFDAVIASIEKVEEISGKKVSIILCGDYYQLAPVITDADREVLESIYGDVGSGFAFASKFWQKRKLELVELHQVVRQNDKLFVSILNDLRKGNVTAIDTLNQYVSAPDQHAINLLPNNTAVDNINQAALTNINAPMVDIPTIREGDINNPDYKSVCPADLRIKVGARIIMTKNDTLGSDCALLDLGSKRYTYRRSKPIYHNGSAGTIMHIDNDAIYIELDNGKSIVQHRYRCEVHRQIVDDETGKINIAYLGYYEQYPIKIAYALTIHRSQGATYDAVNIDPTCFAHGQLYTAISRVTSLEGLHLIKPIRPEDIIVDLSVQQFYEAINATGSTYRFGVYEHRIVQDDAKLIKRNFIVLKDMDGNIIGWTDYHKYARSGKRARVKSIFSDNRAHCICIVSLLNYVFFGRYHITKLTDITGEMVKNYLNDYGLCRLPTDDVHTHRSKETVNTCVSYIIDFLDLMIRDNNKCKMRLDDLYRTEKVFDKRKKRYVEKKVPTFEVHYKLSKKQIFRDLPEGAFQILMDEIVTNHKNILMLAALSAFAGLRPSESCNVRRVDSVLGPGLMFETQDDEVINVLIDLTEEKNLRSDFISVGNIKKERMQKVYPAFLEAFVDCYNVYMDYVKDRPYEAGYGALTNTSFGKAYTYEAYYKEFKNVVKDSIPRMLASDDPEIVHYGHMLQVNTISPHIFRHWFSVKLTLYGEDVAGLMHWRGDKSPESALTYLMDKSELEKQYEKVSDEVFNYSLWKAGKMVKEHD